MPVATVILAGTHSGAGKTTVTLAVMAALVRRGLRVQGFKVGPDFIDPGHHARVTGRISRNLDTWLLDPAALARSFRRASLGADLALVEGVMGLFDGRGSLEEAGSTADLARAWDVPVVLVVDARGLSRSIAPMVRGFADFDPRVRVAGVIANRVGSRSHHDEYLAPALRAGTQVEPLGFLTRSEAMRIPSRHLGLWTADEHPLGPAVLETMADAAETQMDLDRLIDLAAIPKLPAEELDPIPPTRAAVRLALARDPAFCFYYQDNIDLFEVAGAEVVTFSPLDDSQLPDGTEVLYLGGGYPEVFAERIAGNAAMRSAIRRFHAGGGPIYAECGGLMACCRELRDASGSSFPMWDLIPARVMMHPRFVALGYVTVVGERASLLGPTGTELRGHEFHYSSLEPLGRLTYATRLIRPRRDPQLDGIEVGSLLAAYAHAHFGSNPEAARNLLLGLAD